MITSLLFMLSILCSTYRATITSISLEDTHDAQLKGAKVLDSMALMPETSNITNRAHHGNNPHPPGPGSRYQGLFILCEGPLPTARLFYTRDVATSYYPSLAGGWCKPTEVYGNGQKNHAFLWRDFTGLDTYYERLYSCAPYKGWITIARRVGYAPPTTVYTCPRPYDAIVIIFRI